MYSVVASDIEHEMGCVNKIYFLYDINETTPTGKKVIGKVKDLAELNCEYINIIVSMNLPDNRFNFLTKIQKVITVNSISL